MREQVTSTRTRFDDFKRKWKKDRRFYSFGRDDKEREKSFKVHLRELGERKRADAQRAETDFEELLKEQEGIKGDSTWTEVKKIPGLAKDPRYDAVGSSSLRQELFDAFVKKIQSLPVNETPEQAAERKIKERKEKAQQSLREREAKVREEKERVEKEVGRSKSTAGREEAERLYGTLLVDQVRDPEVSGDFGRGRGIDDRRYGPTQCDSYRTTQGLTTPHSHRLTSKGCFQNTSPDSLPNDPTRCIPCLKPTPRPSTLCSILCTPKSSKIQ